MRRIACRTRTSSNGATWVFMVNGFMPPPGEMTSFLPWLSSEAISLEVIRLMVSTWPPSSALTWAVMSAYSLRTTLSTYGSGWFQ